VRDKGKVWVWVSKGRGGVRVGDEDGCVGWEWLRYCDRDGIREEFRGEGDLTCDMKLYRTWLF
jgi:hypothetical protein